MLTLWRVPLEGGSQEWGFMHGKPGAAWRVVCSDQTLLVLLSGAPSGRNALCVVKGWTFGLNDQLELS